MDIFILFINFDTINAEYLSVEGFLPKDPLTTKRWFATMILSKTVGGAYVTEP